MDLNSSKAQIAVISVFIIMFLIIFGVTTNNFKTSLASGRWPTTKGVVKSSGIGHDSNSEGYPGSATAHSPGSSLKMSALQNSRMFLRPVYP
jgi:hypothetical protein